MQRRYPRLILATLPIIRRMNLAEFSFALDWAVAEGRKPRPRRRRVFFAADPDGFLVSEIERRLVAIVSLMRYGALFGFLDFYIVHPDECGKRYALAMCRAMALGLSATSRSTACWRGSQIEWDNHGRL